ncbi:ABC transporter permease [Caballeronia grimmiae]|uniref:Taurine ABC transporter permease n=1 Tax=Caballeronia grimmiae TaxID=1071679 RepID=A0A069NGW8_9BURK|nr:ABC transporter permease [Caballeronia grimmiae]KDR27595.1 taurine ABC transporter permease [Caballeronia grimmiae]GGD83819.1 hypothetical protein GCM10010985_42930 [Caballeronia grimmiae]
MSDASLELQEAPRASQDAHAAHRKKRWRGFVLPLLAFALWWFVSRDAKGSHGLLVSPVQVLQTALEQVRSGALLRAMTASLTRELTGFFIGSSLGLALGALLGVSKIANRAIAPSFNTFKQVSLFAWIPLISVWFGLGDLAKVVFLSLAALVPVVVHTNDGIRAAPPRLLEVARAYRYSKLQLLTAVVLPAALPSIFTGVYLALIYSWLATLGAEYLLVAGSGIGNTLVDGSEQFRMDLVLFGVIVVGLTGWALNALARAIQRRWFDRRAN